MTTDPTPAASFERLTHRQSVGSLSLFYSHYFRCSFELAKLVPLPYSRGTSARYSNKLQEFSATIPTSCKDLWTNSFFSRPASLWNSLIVCFPLTSPNANGFKFIVNRYLFSLNPFFSMCCFVFFLTFITPCLIVTGHHCVEWNKQISKPVCAEKLSRINFNNFTVILQTNFGTTAKIQG